MIKIHRGVRTLLLAVLLVTAGGAGAQADNGGPDVEGGHGHSHAAPVAEAKVEAFAAAATAVQEISAAYLPKIEAAREAGDKQRARRHGEQARDEMTAAIEKQEGISVQEYQSIAQRARQDADLAARIRQRMGE